MAETWLWTTVEEVGLVFISAVGILAAVIVVIRIVGLRSFSKMSSFDFAVTVAIGSIVAGVAATSSSLAHGALALGALLGAQWVISKLRRHAKIGSIFDNDPLLLMDGSRLLQDNLAKARVTDADLYGKLREANVTHMDQVLAVVFESTGDVSVLHGDGPLDERVLTGVRGLDRSRQR